MAMKQDPNDPEKWTGEVWHQGERTKLTYRGTSKGARVYEAQRRLEIQKSGIINLKDVPNFTDFVDNTYEPAAKVELRASTWNVRRYHLKDLKEHFGRLQLTKITEQHVESYKTARREDVGKVSVNNELMALSAVLTYARDVLRIPCAKPAIKRFPRIKRKKGNVQFFTREEVGYILASCPPDFLPLVTFLFETGCRKSEALNLTWKNVQFDQKIVRIWSEAGADDEEEEEATTIDSDASEEAYEVKSVEREIPLSPRLLRVLKEQRSRELVFPVRKNNQEYTKGKRYVLFPKHTWLLTLTRANELAKDAATKAGTKAPRKMKGGPHKCRHTFASFFLATKPDLFQLGKLLGHTSTKVTELYSHLMHDHLDELRASMPSFEAATPPVKEAAE